MLQTFNGDNYKNDRLEGLNQLNNSSFVFYLTGSRAFNKASANSDYDFFTEYTIQVEDFLIGLGFQKLCSGDNQYGDSKTKAVYRFSDIDIQLVDDVNKKIKIHDFLSSKPSYLIFLDALKKNQRKQFWNILYSLIP